MRKQDRIANQQQNRSKEDKQHKPQSSETQPRDREQMRGSATEAQRPQRQSGKLPLPD